MRYFNRFARGLYDYNSKTKRELDLANTTCCICIITRQNEINVNKTIKASIRAKRKADKLSSHRSFVSKRKAVTFPVLGSVTVLNS